MSTIRGFFLTCCCVAMLSTIAYGTDLTLKPIDATGDFYWEGDEIILEGGGQAVILEIRVDDWQSSDVTGRGVCDDGTECSIALQDCDTGWCYSNNGLMAGWSATIDSSGYAGVLGPSFPECDDDEDCQIYDPEPAGTCNTTEEKCNPDACAFIDSDRADYVFLGAGTEYPAVRTVTLDYGFLSALGSGGVLYGDVEKYCATLVLDVPAVGAAGTYTIGFVDVLAKTNVPDTWGYRIVPFVLTPAVITVHCTDTNDCDDGDECTNDGCNIVSGECEYTYNFDTGPDGIPYNEDDVECCDPATGTNLPIDDGNDCTADECDPETGQVTHPPLPPGTACEVGVPGGDCDAQDTCDGAGTCVENYQPVDTPCGSDLDDDCTDPDTCDDAGTCLDNHEPPDTPCGSPLDDDCTDPDTCDGEGTCEPNHEPVDTPCGDDTQEECNDPDTCDGAGMCLDNHWPNGADCDDGLYCNVDEECTDGECGGGSARDCGDGIPCTTDTCNEATDQCDNDIDPGSCLISGICRTEGEENPANDCEECNTALSTTSWSPKGVGAACGSPLDDDCTDPDTCDGAGTCLPNHEDSGTPCGDDTEEECNDPDTCDDAGVCLDNHWPNGTGCDDDLYCNVGETCTDGECGNGTARDCSDAFSCTDDSCNEGGDTCVNTPNNTHCDNGQYCDGVEICDPDDPGANPVTGCVLQAGSVPNCDDLVGCTDDSCNEGTDQCDNIPNDANCDDDQYCNGEETCDPELDCLPGTDIDCDDGFDCTNDSCNEVSDECDNIPNDLLCPDDGLWCNGDEVCDPEDPEATPDGCAHANLPCGGPCDEENDVCLCEAPVAASASSRYLTITPLPADADTPMALLVTGDCPGGITKWVGEPVPFDYNDDGSPDALLGFLGDEAQAVYLKPAAWGATVYVTGEHLAPGLNYIIHADCGTPGTPGLSAPGNAETMPRGDVDDDGVAGLGDIIFCIFAFQGDYAQVTVYHADLMGVNPPRCQPDQVIGLADIMEFVAAFQEQPPYYCPDLCP